MPHVAVNFMLQFFVTGFLGIVTYAGDKLVETTNITLFRGIYDNLTHATVGGLAWTLILVLSKKPILPNIYSIIYCVILSSIIDVDHFFAARSWSLKDATRLNGRPLLHCTTIPIVLWLLLMYCSKTFDSPSIGNYGWIVLSSFLSHHIRDGSRRGLWFGPIGSTRPIPYYPYIALSMGLPYIIFWLMYLTSAPVVKDYTHRTINIV